MKTEQKIIDVKIHGMSQKGNGLGHYAHPHGITWTLEVPFTVEGDFVRVRVIKKHAGTRLCRLIEILEPSPQRVVPKCIHFQTCGGCRWQHIAYENQLKRKEQLVTDTFASFLTPNVALHPITPSPLAWEYRNKMEFSFSNNTAGEKFLGLMMDNSKGRVLNLQECHLVHNWMIDLLKAVRKWWDCQQLDAYYPPKNKGSLRTLVVREGFRTQERLVMLTVSGNPDYALHRHHIDSFVEAVSEAAELPQKHDKLSIFLRIQQTCKNQPTNFYEIQLYGPDAIQEKLQIHRPKESLPEWMTFSISPSAFFQPNPLQAEILYSLALKHANIPPDALIYDLYCGTGTLGICLAKSAKEVIAVELSPESTLDAKTNLTLNNISNMRVITGDVGEVLKKMRNQPEISKPDVVVVDPPRTGLDPQAIQVFLELKPQIILYISCNPKTQALNLANLIEGGYALNSLQPVDQFPQTVHIENIAVLTRKEN